MKRCLYCYQLLKEDEIDFHPACSRKFFGDPVPPHMKYTEMQIEGLAYQLIQNSSTVTGIQPQIAVNLTAAHKKEPRRFTIVGLSGGYILKPPNPDYQHLPEVQDLTMHLAELAGIQTLPHSLIRLQSGSLAYITKRIDRDRKGHKIHVEDMCQLTERLTEDKYHGSYEEIGKIILKHSMNPGLDVVNFCEQVVFAFITGNADMHLKNYSLIRNSSNSRGMDKGMTHQLGPAYDLAATALVRPDDTEELALNLNGKKKELGRRDFDEFFVTLGLEQKQRENILRKMSGAKGEWLRFIDISFLQPTFRQAYQELISMRLDRLEI